MEQVRANHEADQQCGGLTRYGPVLAWRKPSQAATLEREAQGEPRTDQGILVAVDPSRENGTAIGGLFTFVIGKKGRAIAPFSFGMPRNASARFCPTVDSQA
jgi:hypothetical protein